MKYFLVLLAVLTSQSAFSYDFSGNWKVVSSQCVYRNVEMLFTTCDDMDIPEKLVIKSTDKGYELNFTTGSVVLENIPFNYNKISEISSVANVLEENKDWGTSIDYRQNSNYTGQGYMGPYHHESRIVLIKQNANEQLEFNWYEHLFSNEKGINYGTILLSTSRELKLIRE